MACILVKVAVVLGYSNTKHVLPLQVIHVKLRHVSHDFFINSNNKIIPTTFKFFNPILFGVQFAILLLYYKI